MDSTDNNIPWQERVARKQENCFEKIPTEWRIPTNSAFWDNFSLPFAENKTDLVEEQAIRKSGILTDRELDITENYTVSSLLACLAKGDLTSSEVTLAYCKRAAVAQQLVSSIVNDETTNFDSCEIGKLSHGDHVR